MAFRDGGQRLAEQILPQDKSSEVVLSYCSNHLALSKQPSGSEIEN